MGVASPAFHPSQSSTFVFSINKKGKKKKNRFNVQNSPTAVLAMSVGWCPGVMTGGECVGCWMLRLRVATAAKALSQQGWRLPVRLERSAASNVRELAPTSPEMFNLHFHNKWKDAYSDVCWCVNDQKPHYYGHDGYQQRWHKVY